jgi:hypothetical protein
MVPLEDGSIFRFQHVPNIPNEETVFFGGKDYLPLLCSLTGETPNRKTIFSTLRVRRKRRAGICGDLRQTRTNWHYECAAEFLDFSDGRNTKHRELGYRVHVGRNEKMGKKLNTKQRCKQ